MSFSPRRSKRARKTPAYLVDVDDDVPLEDENDEYDLPVDDSGFKDPHNDTAAEIFTLFNSVSFVPLCSSGSLIFVLGRTANKTANFDFR